MNISDFLNRLSDVRPTGEKKWSAKCPCHDDNRNSLTIAAGDKGGIVICCHANCENKDIVGKLGLRMSDLMPPQESATGAKMKTSGRIERTYDYCDEADELLFQEVRFEGKGFSVRRPDPDAKGKWIWNLKGVRDGVIYGLSDIIGCDQTIYIPEGPKDCEMLANFGLFATTNALGAGKFTPEHAKHFKGKRVVILVDNDKPGRDHGQQVAALCHAAGAISVKVLLLPDLDIKEDVTDWLNKGHDVGELERLAAECSEWRPGMDDLRPEDLRDDDTDDPDTIRFAGKAYDPASGQTVDVDEEKEQKKSQATLLVEIAKDCELFHNPSGDAFVRFPVDDHFEVSPVRNRSFKRWLARQFYLQHGKTPSAQALVDCMNVLEGMAVFSGPEHEVHIRTAEHAGAIYVDLCNPAWQVVKITADGWEVVSNPPVMFRRAKAQLALPTPIEGGSLGALRKYVNVTDEEWPLALAWLVQAIRPEGPYPALSIYGEQGSAKSTTARALRQVIDPNTAPLRCEPREPRDLMIAASNSFIPALDNLSHISTWLSDALCRMATGGGFSTRTLYEDSEETIFVCQRPVIMTAIEEVATRGDLLDRCIILNLPRISEEGRRPESEIEEEFERDHPAILGALLTAVSTAMRRLPSIKLERLPRMADFAIWATAAEPALDLADGEFLQAYCANRAAGNETALESSPLGKAVITFVQTSLAWSGTSSELLAELENVADDRTKRLKSWPATPRALGASIKRLAPNLRATGIGVEFSRAGKQRSRMITLTACEGTGDFASASSAKCITPEKQAKQADAKSQADAIGSEADASGHVTPLWEADTKSDVGRKADANANGHRPPQSLEKQGEDGSADAKHVADAKLPRLSEVGVADDSTDWWEV